MPRLAYTQSARDDLADIVAHIAEVSGHPPVARGFARAIRRQCCSLAALPGTLGRARLDLGRGLRSYVFKGYVIFFRYEPSVLRIVNVIEGHRDMGAHVDPDPI